MTNPGQLIIALEPETAALFCMERKMSKLESERGSDVEDAELAQPQTQYMVVDIGGDGLVVVACYQFDFRILIITMGLRYTLKAKNGFLLF